MNSKPVALKKFLPIILLACFSIALVAWVGQKQTHQPKVRQTFTDTIPKKNADKKIRDLDDAIEELNKVDLKVDLEKAKTEIAEAMKTPRVIDRVVAQGLIPVGSSSADFAAFQNSEIAKYGRMIKDANIKIGN